MQPDKFKISIQLANKPCTLDVSVEPTSDGVDTYVCRSDGKEITHVRKDTGIWKQLWGDQDDKTVDQIGKEIDRILTR